MAEFPAPTPSPARVHELARALVGHHPHWSHAPRSILFHTAHYRTCSYCGCIHPSDMMALLRSGRSRLEPTPKKNKHILLTPNPIAGREVRMGTQPVPVFNWIDPPQLLRIRLHHEASERDATFAERLVGHIERPLHRPAPAMIEQPFFQDHTTDRQWNEILVAIAQGDERYVTSLSGA